MHRLSLLLAVLFIVPLFGSDSPKEYEDTTVQRDDLDGTWRVVAMELKGAPLFNLKWDETFRAGKWASTDKVTGTYTTNASQKPAHLDRTTVFGVLQCIYQIDGDTLRVGYTLHRTGRPRGFKDEDVVVHTYKRVK